MKYVLILVAFIVFILGVQAYYYSLALDKYCNTAEEVDKKKIEYIQKLARSRDPYVVIHLDAATINYWADKLRKDGKTKYRVCVRIPDYDDSVEVFAATGPLWWYTFKLKAAEEPPYLKIKKVSYTVFPLPEFVRRGMQSEVINVYRDYFQKRIPTRKIDRVEIQEGEVWIYTNYF